ncbi:MAG: MotA/TolQ/ExbB proton channel family protein [Deltaproteobacteria bacterium]|nr:MAG: MotA/TolQ/ExbB proton channel family protein [Deltaproteobacteria bacterium]
MTFLGKLLQQGGWAMWPIYFCSLVALVVFIQRWMLFREIRAKSLPWLDDVLLLVRRRQYNAAISECESHEHPVAHVLSRATDVYHERPDRVAAEAERVGLLEIERYERFLPLLSFIAQVAPLLGLLGTVIGMVKMFLGLQSAGLGNVNASQLASGIWQALLTTAAGLIVAAPTLAAHLYLSTRVDHFRTQLRDAVERFLTALPSPLARQGRHEAVAAAVVPVKAVKPAKPANKQSPASGSTSNAPNYTASQALPSEQGELDV